MKPYTTWTLLVAVPGHKSDGSFYPYRWHYHKRGKIPAYWRGTLKDLAEYTGGP